MADSRVAYIGRLSPQRGLPFRSAYMTKQVASSDPRVAMQHRSQEGGTRAGAAADNYRTVELGSELREGLTVRAEVISRTRQFCVLLFPEGIPDRLTSSLP